MILLATAVAGLSGYAVTWLMFRLVGPAAYTDFMVFWSLLYLIIGALSGIQQEVARATYPRHGGSSSKVSRLRNFGLVSAAVVMIVILSTGPFWGLGTFGSAGPLLVVPLALGATSYVMVATLCGALYGIGQLRSLAWVVGVDGVLRLIGILVVSAFSRDLSAFAWAVVVPFAITPLILWVFIRRGVIGKIATDVGYRGMTWNVSRTILASTATGFLVSGFPLLLSVTSSQDSAATIGVLILAITLTRAPLIVTVMALQSYLIVRFRDNPGSARSLFFIIESAVIGGGLALGFVGLITGPQIFLTLFDARVEGGFIFLLVLSSSLVAALSVSASAVLALSRHLIYSTGWVLAAIVTFACLTFPIEIVQRVLIALVAGPLVGLAVHVVSLFAWKQRASRIATTIPELF